VTSLTYSERLRGHVSFDADPHDFNEALYDGKRTGTTCSFSLDVTIDDVDRFIADPEHEARCEGEVVCDALGGRMAVERGTFNLLVPAGDDPRDRRMRYRLFVRDRDGRPLTLAGFKVVQDQDFNDVWADTATLFTHLYRGHVAAGMERDEDVVATGILFVTHLAFARLLASMRAHGGTFGGRLAAKARYERLFTGTLFFVYGGPPARTGRPDFPDDAPGAEPFAGFPPGEWHDLPGRPELRRRILAVRANDGFELTLHHIRGRHEPDRGPVLLVAGTGVRVNVFYGAPRPRTLVDVLVDEGYDVYLENWRGSIDLPENEYTLDAAAVHDHPPAVRKVLEESGADRLKAVVHCQGSTSFAMALAAGLLPEVTDVVSNAVSFHVAVPPLSKARQYLLLPLMRPAYRAIDPQWAIRAPALRAWLLARIALLTRRECHEPVCQMSNFTYGVGGNTLWRHENLDDATHRWVSREFGWVPFSFFRQIARCVRAGHLVRVEDLPLPADFVAASPQTDARFTLLAGSRNTCFLPDGQRRTWEWLESLAPGKHAFHELDGYSHLDVFFGRQAHRDVFPLIVDALAG